jgi:hypothetical protein
MRDAQFVAVAAGGLRWQRQSSGNRDIPMQSARPLPFDRRAAAAAPFLVVALAAIVAGGLVAAVTAHAPSRALVWMVAYLVLVVGVAQAALGAGQAWLATSAPSARLVTLQCLLFNLGSAGVIAGTLMASAPWVTSGTAVFAIALLLFLAGTRGARTGGLSIAYRIGLGLLALGATVGVTLSLLRTAA